MEDERRGCWEYCRMEGERRREEEKGMKRG
jgi:hypothetical protein